MHTSRSWLAVGVALGAAAAQSAELTELPPASGTGLERGVVLVRCTKSTDQFAESRGAVLDVGLTAGADVLLTTAHGLPADAGAVQRDCSVLARGEKHAIARVWHAGGNLRGPEHDWAVIVTRHISGDVHRWRAARTTGEWLASAAASRTPVRVVLRYAAADQTDCHLDGRTPDPSVLVAHSCLVYPGASGSPLVVGIERRLTLIGVHVGTRVQWEGTKLAFVSVAKPLDAEVSAAIDAAAAYAAGSS